MWPVHRIFIIINFFLNHHNLLLHSFANSLVLVSDPANRDYSANRSGYNEMNIFPKEDNRKTSPVEEITEDEMKNVEEQQVHEILLDLQSHAESTYEVRSRGYKSLPKSLPLFEGDILLTLGQAKIFSQSLKRRKKRKLTEPLTKLWTLPIPYVFDGSHDETERKLIKDALSYWESLTCISFVQDLNASHKLIFAKQKGCWSYVGFTGQINQTISVGDGCQSNGTIAHELGHAIGFWHEQSRPDRDLFVTIVEENVADNKLYNFITRNWGEVVTYDVPYDLGSDMHYGSKFYAKDTNSTLTTVQTRDPLMEKVIGQRQELSFYDIKLANIAYCSAVCSDPLPQPCRRDGYQDPNNCKVCRCPDGFGGNFCESVQMSENAICGGVLDASHGGVIYSPGYTLPGYLTDVKCSWLIKAPEYSNVYLEFVDNFGMNCHLDVCRDFVEVRYNGSLSLTGARFCCKERPTKILKSNSNEMMVLFRSYKESLTCADKSYEWKCLFSNLGFKARFHAKPCGGFMGSPSSIIAIPSYSPFSQPACWRRVSFLCAQSWVEKTNIDCPKWWQAKSCGSRNINKLRRATCQRDQPYCAPGFQLNRSTVTCYDQTTKQKSNSGPSGQKYEKRKQAWSVWSSWRNCIRNCGGSKRFRTRNCKDASVCRMDVIQTSKRHCNQPPCLTKCSNSSSVVHCNNKKLCLKKECKSFCNQGFVLIKDVCTKHQQRN